MKSEVITGKKNQIKLSGVNMHLNGRVRRLHFAANALCEAYIYPLEFVIYSASCMATLLTLHFSNMTLVVPSSCPMLMAQYYGTIGFLFKTNFMLIKEDLVTYVFHK